MSIVQLEVIRALVLKITEQDPSSDLGQLCRWSALSLCCQTQRQQGAQPTCSAISMGTHPQPSLGPWSPLGAESTKGGLAGPP